MLQQKLYSSNLEAEISVGWSIVPNKNYDEISVQINFNPHRDRICCSRSKGGGAAWAGDWWHRWWQHVREVYVSGDQAAADLPHLLHLFTSFTSSINITHSLQLLITIKAAAFQLHNLPFPSIYTSNINLVLVCPESNVSANIRMDQTCGYDYRSTEDPHQCIPKTCLFFFFKCAVFRLWL